MPAPLNAALCIHQKEIACIKELFPRVVSIVENAQDSNVHLSLVKELSLTADNVKAFIIVVLN